MPHMLAAVLGVRPDGFQPRLDIWRPCLPSWLEWVTVKGLRVGDREVDLRFERSESGTLVAVTRNADGLVVQVQY